tara:strand:- start:7245 stop:7751 length:507 start_codon:yes stop_codon:yes gene_type:complete
MILHAEMTGKTIKELSLKDGEQVRCVHSENSVIVGRVYTKALHTLVNKDGGWIGFYSLSLFVRVEESPTLFGDMTPEEQGALLLAAHNKEVIECRGASGWVTVPRSSWIPTVAYRVKPKPSVEVVTKYRRADNGGWTSQQTCTKTTHEMSYEVVDGELICDSVVITKL